MCESVFGWLELKGITFQANKYFQLKEDQKAAPAVACGQASKFRRSFSAITQQQLT